MSYEPPTPPAEFPTDIVDTLNDSSPELLRHVASYAEELAEHHEREARLAEKGLVGEYLRRYLPIHTVLPESYPYTGLPKSWKGSSGRHWTSGVTSHTPDFRRPKSGFAPGAS